MILADLGADVIRVERPGGQLLTGGPHDLLNRGRPSVALDLKHPDGDRDGARPGRERRRAGRGDATGHHRAARARSRRVPGPQPAPGLRPDDRVGPGRPAGQRRRPRHRTTSRSPARCSGWARTGPAALPGQPGRRLRRRVDVPRDRRAGRPARGARLRRGPGRRRRDRRRHRPPQRDGAGFLAGGALREERGRRTCSTAACRSTTSTRPPTAGTCRSARSSRSSTTSSWTCSASPDARRTATTPARAPSCARLIAERVRARAPRRSGPRSSRAPTPASRRILPLTEAIEHPHMAAREVFVERDGVAAAGAGPALLPHAAPLDHRRAREAGADTREALLRLGDRGRRHPDREGRRGAGLIVRCCARAR